LTRLARALPRGDSAAAASETSRVKATTTGVRPLHALPAAEVLRLVQSRASGLSEEEASERLARGGPNALRAAPPTPAWRVLRDQLRSVVVGLLVVAAAMSLAVGDLLEAAAIGGVLLINTALGFTVELRARRAMEGLLRLEVPRAVVVRGGRLRDVDARELVPGDVIEVEAGVSVPADARLLSGNDVQAVEAALTGESLPVAKVLDALDDDTPLPERGNMLYKGTTVVSGAARAVVVATGMETEIGRIGRLVGALGEERTPLEERLDQLGRRLVWLALLVGLLVAVLGALRGVPWFELVETGLALAVAAVPEGLPAVATITLALGVHRMARRRALVRRLPSVETLGSVTLVCTDKTGTLTAGEPTVTVLAPSGREIEITGAGYEPAGVFVEDGRELAPPLDATVAELLRVGLLANHARLTHDASGWTVQGDPTEAALVVAARKAGMSREACLERHPLVGEVPFSSARMLMATFHRTPNGERYACVKGAPGRILELCARVLVPDGERALDDAERRRLEERNAALARRGLRVLALASGRVDEADETALRDLTFVGFVGMADPIAAGVRETITVFREAGIRTVMITGDQRLTAQAIGEELGIVDDARGVADGRTVARLDDAGLVEEVARIGAFSRISPEDKLRVVAACQAQGEIVAMLGDGVNDAAALRKADVGVAMGIRGTDVAKEAADIVLQDDRFATITPAIEEGRVVFDNIRKFVFYLFSCNLAEVLVLLGGAAAFSLPLLPLQILWLNLVTDTFPALALAIERGEAGIMRRPPRPPDEEILSRPFVRDVAVAAALIAAVTLAAFAIGHGGPAGGEPRAVTMCFVTLALTQALHLGNARSRSRVLAPAEALGNPWAIVAVALVVLLQVAAVEAAPLALVLRTVPLSLSDWVTVLALAAVPAVVGQLAKPAAERRVRAGRGTGGER
jgi:Ca2+-transporting ATPase